MWDPWGPFQPLFAWDWGSFSRVVVLTMAQLRKQLGISPMEQHCCCIVIVAALCKLARFRISPFSAVGGSNASRSYLKSIPKYTFGGASYSRHN